MAVTVKVLPSKIVQVSGVGSKSEYIAYVVCEDGSMWIYNHHHDDYRSIHPPHERPTEAGTIQAMHHNRQLTSEEIAQMATPPTQSADIVQATTQVLEDNDARFTIGLRYVFGIEAEGICTRRQIADAIREAIIKAVYKMCKVTKWQQKSVGPMIKAVPTQRGITDELIEFFFD